MKDSVLKRFIGDGVPAFGNGLKDDLRRERNIGRDAEFESGRKLCGTPLKCGAAVVGALVPEP